MTKPNNKSTAKPTIDLADLNTTEGSDKGARVELVHPVSRVGLGLFFTVYGKHSQVYRDIVRDRIDHRVKRESYAARRNKQLDPRTAAEVEREALELLVSCTIAWDREETTGEGDDARKEVKPGWTFGGEVLDFNVPNAMNLYTNLVWVREQVDNAIGDLENFIPA